MDLEQQQQQKEILKETLIEEEKPISALAEKLAAEKKKRFKKLIFRFITFGVICFLGYAIWWLFFMRREASPRYGICYTLLELVVPYPHTINVSQMKGREGYLLLWFTYTDAFGGYRMEPFECGVVLDPDTKKFKLNRLKIDKVELARDKVEEMSIALTYLNEQPRILNVPRKLPDSLRGLRFNFDSLRRIKLNMDKLY